ncbi:hypothetical protein GOODEAATRI_027204, partial [Goodea atripinnis]
RAPNGTLILKASREAEGVGPHKGAMTKAGLYRTIRRVLDIDGWHLMATEYLECRRCKKEVGGWSQGIVGQLPPPIAACFLLYSRT